MEMMKKMEMDGNESMGNSSAKIVSVIEIECMEDGTYKITSESGQMESGEESEMGEESSDNAGVDEQTAEDLKSALMIVKGMMNSAMGSSAQEAFDSAGMDGGSGMMSKKMPMKERV